MMKVEGSGSASGSGSGSIIQRHGSADPDPHQNVMDPQHCFTVTIVLPKVKVVNTAFNVLEIGAKNKQKPLFVGG
jgi:hypothetical protein